jgi:hypothetical protein
MEIPILDTAGHLRGKILLGSIFFSRRLCFTWLLDKTLGQVWKFLKHRQKMLGIFKIYLWC